MASIKPIESRTVHRIQSGQVIVDLCSVVKELVENSVDAGATSIDVRFKNQGLDVIELQDNGAGITPANYESVCLKHHTSKLSTYDDLASLQTFGFRGEALASLCALSTLSITTCLASDVPKGTSLTFEASGRLQSTSVVAAQKGTTISVEKLFHNLPVRRRELERNIKREWQKVIALLNQYACILTGLKFTVSQQPSKGKRIVLFSTKGNATTRENIINIFSAKMTSQLIPLDLQLEMKSTVASDALQAATNDEAQNHASKEVRVFGHVSRPVHGEGRQTPDRQMFFVNGRPCGLPQFAKTFNEVYRSYNVTQSPFICADIRLDTDMYDVNVSPDKRSIMLHDQNQMLDTLRASLIALFDSHEYTLPLAGISRRTPAKPGRTPSQPSTFRFTQVTNADSSSSGQFSVDGSDEDSQEGSDEGSDEGSNEDEDVEPSSQGERLPIHNSGLAGGTARRIPSANSLSRGGPHSQSLLHSWVNSRVPVPASGTAKTKAANKSDSPEPDALITQHGSNSVLRPPKAKDETDSSDEETGTEEPGQISRRASIGGREGASHPSTLQNSIRGIDTESEPIPSLERTFLAFDRDKSPLIHRSSKRYTPELATVTIGNETSTSWIGVPSNKPRSVTPEESGTQHLSFGTHLTRKFAARELNSPMRDPESSLLANSSVVGMSEDESVAESEKGIEASTEDHEGIARRVSPSRIGHNEPSPDGDDEALSVPRETDIDGKSLVLQHKSAEEDAQPRVAAFETARRRKDDTLTLQQEINMSEDVLQTLIVQWEGKGFKSTFGDCLSDKVEDIADPDAETKLSLVISREDFSRMRVVGQFNLGFIIAIRPATALAEDLGARGDDELFIIDQHASDEKYNFERLQSETVVQSQRLVQPKRLELTALEEEIVMQNLTAIEANGFKVEMDSSGESQVGARCQLLALPLTRETTFNLTDLEELISLLGDHPHESSHIPRPAKVRKMFAMRACRSSVMIGKALTHSQMYGLVKHMGEMDKPWNCPHGRPTMRHLSRLQALDQQRWKEDVGIVSRAIWGDYMGD